MAARDVTVERLTVDDVLDRRERLALEGARLSYLQNCESMQRVEARAVRRQTVDRSHAGTTVRTPGPLGIAAMVITAGIGVPDATPPDVRARWRRRCRPVRARASRPP
jgi:hypothetical protein